MWSCHSHFKLSEYCTYGACDYQVPFALRESKHDLLKLSNEVVRISYLDSEGEQWRDITGQLEGPVTVEDGIVKFKVKHFCR